MVPDAPNLGWTDVPLARLVAEAVDLPVHVANDANAAALAEHSLGGAVDRGLLVLTIGLGVGAGLLLDGALLLGHRLAAGEIGHVVVDERGRPAPAGGPAAWRPCSPSRPARGDRGRRPRRERAAP